jgi:hypothetical protein
MVKKKNTASFLATLSIARGFKEAPEKLEDQWRNYRGDTKLVCSQIVEIQNTLNWKIFFFF